jgi:hypothetical protein
VPCRSCGEDVDPIYRVTQSRCRVPPDSGLESLLHLGVAVIDEEETRGVESVTIEAVDDGREAVELMKDERDMVREDLGAVGEEKGEDGGEVGDGDLASNVLVLKDVA